MAHDVRDNATLVAAESDVNPESNLVWGAAGIGRIVNRKPEQVRRLHQAGFFGNAVWKAGHRTLVGSIPRLRNLGSI